MSDGTPEQYAEILDMLARDQDNESAMHGHLAAMPFAHDQYREQQRELVKFHKHKADALRADAAALVGGNFANWIAASRAVIRGDAGAVSDLYDAMPTDEFQRAFEKPKA